MKEKFYIMKVNELDYLKPIEIADGIYWIGNADEGTTLHCNPYIIIDGDQAVVIDSGNRDDFSTVMLKILRLGVNPYNIRALIFHHADPDLCASIPQFEAMIDNRDVEIISDRSEHIFVRYYSSSDLSKSKRVCIDEIGYEYSFSSGRKLKFIETPFAHAPGSFMTYDTKTKTLFSSDIFGSLDENWSLYKHLINECKGCTPKDICEYRGNECTVNGIVKFHQTIMPSSNALKYALDQIKSLGIKLIAPQHGSLIDRKFDREIIIENLESLEEVGFDYHMKRRGI